MSDLHLITAICINSLANNSTDPNTLDIVFLLVRVHGEDKHFNDVPNRTRLQWQTKM
jgi:hypothetical protein